MNPFFPFSPFAPAGVGLAESYFARLQTQGLTLSEPRKAAYRIFFASGQSEGWLSRIIEMHSYEGTTLPQVAEKMYFKSGNSALTNNGYTLAGLRPEGGLKMTGTSAYWSTINANTLTGGLFGFHTWFREAFYGINGLVMGVPNTTTPFISWNAISFTTPNGQQISSNTEGTGTGTGPGIGRGMHSLERSTLSLVEHWTNKTRESSSTTPVAGSLRNASIRVAQAPLPVDFSAISDGQMTSAQRIAFSNAVELLMRSLGRVETNLDTIYSIIVGQSLSRGEQGTPVVSLVPPYKCRMPANGTRSNSNTRPPCSFGLLVERDVQTVASTAANTASKLWRDTHPGDGSRDMTFSNWGVNSAPYAQLKKGTTPYDSSVLAISNGKILHDFVNRGNFSVPLVTAVHGEADSNSTTYQADIEQWQVDYETDIKAVTGFTGTIPILHSQPSAWTSFSGPATARSPYAILAAYEANPTKHILVCPKYFVPYADGLHLTGDGYYQLGDYYGKAIRSVMDTGTFSPLRPTSIVRSGNIITVSFAGRVGNLVLDTVFISDPGNYGFEWAQTGGTAQTISSVALINSNTQIQITLSGDPGTPTTERLRYAYTGTPGANGGRTTGPRGCLRDSDPTTGQGGATLPNYCVHFDKPVTP